MDPIAPIIDVKTGLPVSPTGTPVLPTWLGPAASALGGVALMLTQTLPPQTIGFKIATIVLGVCGLFGPITVGWRK